MVDGRCKRGSKRIKTLGELKQEIAGYIGMKTRAGEGERKRNFALVPVLLQLSTNE